MQQLFSKNMQHLKSQWVYLALVCIWDEVPVQNNHIKTYSCQTFLMIAWAAGRGMSRREPTSAWHGSHCELTLLWPASH